MQYLMIFVMIMTLGIMRQLVNKFNIKIDDVVLTYEIINSLNLYSQKNINIKEALGRRINVVNQNR
jgi:hypothetical protein